MKPAILIVALIAIVIIITTLTLPHLWLSKKEEKYESDITLNTTTTLYTTLTTEIQTTMEERAEEETKSTEKNKVYIYSNRFEPSYIEINVGENITFVNLDSREHVLEFSNPPLTKRILPKDNFTFTFNIIEEVSVKDNNGFSLIIKVKGQL